MIHMNMNIRICTMFVCWCMYVYMCVLEHEAKTSLITSIYIQINKTLYIYLSRTRALFGDDSSVWFSTRRDELGIAQRGVLSTMTTSEQETR